MRVEGQSNVSCGRLWGGEVAPGSTGVSGFCGGWEAAISQQAISLGCAQLPGSTTKPSAPSQLGWFLRASGAGVGEAAGALAHSGMGTWGASSPALLSSQQQLSQPPPPARAV